MTAMPPSEVQRRAYNRHAVASLKAYKERMERMKATRRFPSNPMDSDWFPPKSIHDNRTRMCYIVWYVRKFGERGGTIFNHKNVPDAIAEELKRNGIEITARSVKHGLDLGQKWDWFTQQIHGKRTISVELLTSHPGIEPPKITAARPVIGATKAAPTAGAATAAPTDVRPVSTTPREPAQVAARLDRIHFGEEQPSPVTHRAPADGPATGPAKAAREVIARSTATATTARRLGAPPLPKPPPEPAREAYREAELLACIFRFEDEDLDAAKAWVDQVIEQLTPEPE